jgi:hypothetical protein
MATAYAALPFEHSVREFVAKRLLEGPSPRENGWTACVSEIESSPPSQGIRLRRTRALSAHQGQKLLVENQKLLVLNYQGASERKLCNAAWTSARGRWPKRRLQNSSDSEAPRGALLLLTQSHRPDFPAKNRSLKGC